MDKASKSLSDLHSFQLCSVVVAFVAFCCFYYTGRYSQDNVAQVEKYSNLIEPEEPYANGFVDVVEVPSPLSRFLHPETGVISKV